MACRGCRAVNSFACSAAVGGAEGVCRTAFFTNSKITDTFEGMGRGGGINVGRGDKRYRN